MSHTTIHIAGREIGKGKPCFVVAEVSGNHNGDYAMAEAIVRAAAEAGADAIKLQTYTQETMTIDSDKPWFYLQGDDTPASWKAQNLYGLYGTAYTPWEWQPKLKELTESLGLVFFSSAFDATSVDFLEKMDVPCYKIASYEATDIPLLQKVAATGKPVILSVGFAVLEEVEEAVAALRAAGAKDLAVLHCVTAYQGDAHDADMNLSTIEDIAKRFGVVVGFSDNNGGIEAPVAAVLAGASIIEKHVTLSRAAGGPDARFSLEPQELKAMVERIRGAERILGTPTYGPVSPQEERYKMLRRSLFAVQDIKAGEEFSAQSVRVIRPAHGLPPKMLPSVLGRRASRDIERGTPLSLEDIADA